MRIRRVKPEDEDSVWSIIREVIGDGDTYVFARDTPKEQMMSYWINPNHHTYVALIDGDVVGTYLLKNNQPDLGSHIANASYMVARSARGMGVGQAMGENSLAEAKSLGYHAIQFNIVVATNEGAIRLWQRLGFEIIGTIPEAFQHPDSGLVDAHVMYRKV